MDDLVSTTWLAERLGAPRLRILDASSHLPAAGRNAVGEFHAAHIPGASFLDLASWTDPDSAVPAALPNADQFAARLSLLRVGADDNVVLYDDSEVKTSARAWFIFRHFGFSRVAILDGGLGKWKAESRPLTSASPAATTPTNPVQAAEPRSDVRSKADVLANLAEGGEQVVDARGAGRFSGAEPEIRSGMPSGHIPGSRNLPFGRVLNHDGTFKDAAGVRAAFVQAGIDLAQPVVTTCGSGVTAAVLLFALHSLGKQDVALYDGSWSEWALDPQTPKASGPAA